MYWRSIFDLGSPIQRERCCGEQTCDGLSLKRSAQRWCSKRTELIVRTVSAETVPIVMVVRVVVAIEISAAVTGLNVSAMKRVVG